MNTDSLKTALIGQDIPTLLPSLLADLLFSEKQAGAVLYCECPNPAMSEVLQGYSDAVFNKAGLGGGLYAVPDAEQALRDADCVIYAGDCQPASRFRQDLDALSGDDPDDPGLTEQARVNGGLGGLMHTLRAGNEALRLCDMMDALCPHALVINLGAPISRVTEIFLSRGYRCFGLGPSPAKGTNGLEELLRLIHVKPDTAEAVMTGLPSFSFLISLERKREKTDLLPMLCELARAGELGRLTKRWLDWWGAVPVGNVTAHAELLPAQPDYMPDTRPRFGESVEERKKRILYMNTVREKGLGDREGMMAQMLLLSAAPAIRPVRLALSLIKGRTVTLPAVARRNDGELKQLPDSAVIESPLTLDKGRPVPHGYILPGELADIMTAIDAAGRLAARAATGDRAALREHIETDPALDGLDRLYCMDVADALIRLHGDVLTCF